MGAVRRRSARLYEGKTSESGRRFCHSVGREYARYERYGDGEGNTQTGRRGNSDYSRFCSRVGGYRSGSAAGWRKCVYQKTV